MYNVTQSDCAGVGNGPTDLVYIFIVNSESALQSALAAPISLFNGSAHQLVMSDGPVGVAEGGSLPIAAGTANALQNLGLSTYNGTGNSGTTGTTGSTGNTGNSG